MKTKINQRGVHGIEKIDLTMFDKEGFKDIGGIRMQFEEIIDLIYDMIVTIGETEIPSSFANEINDIMAHAIAISNKVDAYTVLGDSQFITRDKIVKEISEWHSGIFHGYTSGQMGLQSVNNFLQVYNWSKNIRLNEIDQNESNLALKRMELQSFIDQAKQGAESVKTIASELRINASDQTFREYADIFNKEARTYSNFRIEKWRWFFKIKFGSSQLWLCLGITLAALFGMAILNQEIENLLPVKIESAKQFPLSQVFTRVVALALWIYLITFSFRQFSISKHLATVNRHRANALNSYKLFTESIEKSDTESRNALMLNVAKAIYDQGETGYLTSRTRENTSILEVTRMLGSQNKN